MDIRLSRDRLVITNPGGLYALTTSQLGHPEGRSAPNEFLYAICQHLRGPDGIRVVEGEGGGITEVREALRGHGLEAPDFYDTGVAFTAVVHRPRPEQAGQGPRTPHVVLTPQSAPSPGEAAPGRTAV